MDIALDSNFEAVIAFEFYDGAETGVALLASGFAVKFSSLGDSESRLKRAFEFSIIKGDWKKQIDLVRSNEPKSTSTKFWLPSKQTAHLTALEAELDNAQVIATYVGIGSPYLENVETKLALPSDLKLLREVSKNGSAFEKISAFLETSIL
jgi:hypothetical protein